MYSLLSSRNSSIFELYIYKPDTISPLILNTSPSPSSPQFSHSLPHLSFNHQVPDSLVPWGHFLSWSGRSKTCADVQNMIYFMSLTFLLHFFLQKLIQFYCWRKLSFCCTKTKKHFAVKMATFLSREKWWLVNPLQKKTETWHEVIIFIWAAYLSFHFFFDRSGFYKFKDKAISRISPGFPEK